MYREERTQEILNLLGQSGYATVSTLAARMHISESSVRRDLAAMELRGLVLRSYGGVKLSDYYNKIAPFSVRFHENAAKKRAIAHGALRLIGKSDIIFLDGSSTVAYLSELLVQKPDITVITNSIAAIGQLSRKGVNVIGTGGEVNRENTSVFAGEIAESMVSGIHANLFFFSAESLSENGEISVMYGKEAALRRKMLERSDKSIFLCDSTKFSKCATYRICSVGDIDYLISDGEPKLSCSGRMPELIIV